MQPFVENSVNQYVIISLLVAGLIATQTTTDGTFDSAGVKIRYATAGAGTPAILLHGWMGDLTSWGKASDGSPRLNAPPGFRVIALDLRGHGESGKPHETSQYGKEMARDVIRLMDHLKLKRAHLVGYSMGSFVAGNVVELAPDRVRSVIYGGGAPILDIRSVKGFSDAEAFSRAVTANKGMGEYLVSVLPEGSPKLTSAQADALAKRAFGSLDLKAMAAVGNSFPAMEIKATKIGSLRFPSLFIHGDRESKFVQDRVREAAGAIEGSQVVKLAGKNHLSTLSAPDFGKNIVDFWQENPVKEERREVRQSGIPHACSTNFASRWNPPKSRFGGCCGHL